MIKPGEWQENKFKKRDYYFIEDDELLVAVRVKNNKTGTEKWEYYHIIAGCDGESLWWNKAYIDEPWDEWDFRDVDYYIPLNSHGPMTKSQMEKLI